MAPITLLVDDSVAVVVVEHNGAPAGMALPPEWQVTIDLGPEPSPGLIEAVAFDAEGRLLETARQWINLPRPPAEVELSLSRGVDGVGAVASLAWDSVLGPELEGLTITLDGVPLPADDPRRVLLPAHDPGSLHFLRAEARFPDGITAVKELSFGGPLGDTLSTELAAIPLELEGRRAPQVTELEHRLVVDGQPLGVVAVEKGTIDLVVVADRASGADLSRLASAAQRLRLPAGGSAVPQRRHSAQRIAPLARGSRLTAMLTIAEQLPGTAGTRSVFQPTPEVSEWDGGLFWHLLRAPRPPEGAEERLADAVAVAGLMAARNGRRRAVILLLGGGSEDASDLTPGAARRFLSRLGVPLYVWVSAPALPPAAQAWGDVDHVASLSAFEGAASRLQRRLDRQRLVWVDGFHLPHRVQAMPGIPGARLLATDPDPTSDGQPTEALELQEETAKAVELPLLPPQLEPRLGAWELSTDLEAPRLLAALSAVASHLPAAYEERYGLQVPEPASELVLLFRSQESFREMLRRDAPELDSGVQGHARDGVAALYVGSRSETAVRTTLVHELTHLQNRRAFVGELPPWLEEGLAEDMASSRVDRQGRLLPGALRIDVRTREPALASGPQGRGYEVVMEGPIAAITALLRARERGVALSLAELVELDRTGFTEPNQRQLCYATAGLLVTFLLEGERRSAFRDFLASVAAGGAVDSDALEAALGEPLHEVEAAFHRWLRQVRLTALRSPGGW